MLLAAFSSSICANTAHAQADVSQADPAESARLLARIDGLPLWDVPGFRVFAIERLPWPMDGDGWVAGWRLAGLRRFVFVPRGSGTAFYVSVALPASQAVQFAARLDGLPDPPDWEAIAAGLVADEIHTGGRTVVARWRGVWVRVETEYHRSAVPVDDGWSGVLGTMQDLSLSAYTIRPLDLSEVLDRVDSVSSQLVPTERRVIAAGAGFYGDTSTDAGIAATYLVPEVPSRSHESRLRLRVTAHGSVRQADAGLQRSLIGRMSGPRSREIDGLTRHEYSDRVLVTIGPHFVELEWGGSLDGLADPLVGRFFDALVAELRRAMPVPTP